MIRGQIDANPRLRSIWCKVFLSICHFLRRCEACKLRFPEYICKSPKVASTSSYSRTVAVEREQAQGSEMRQHSSIPFVTVYMIRATSCLKLGQNREGR